MAETAFCACEMAGFHEWYIITSRKTDLPKKTIFPRQFTFICDKVRKSAQNVRKMSKKWPKLSFKKMGWMYIVREMSIFILGKKFFEL